MQRPANCSKILIFPFHLKMDFVTCINISKIVFLYIFDVACIYDDDDGDDNDDNDHPTTSKENKRLSTNV